MPSPYRSLQLQRDRLPIEWQPYCANLMKLAEMLRAHFPYSDLHIFEKTTRENRHKILEHSRKYLSRMKPLKEGTPLLPGDRSTDFGAPNDCPLTNYSSQSTSVSLALPSAHPSLLRVPTPNRPSSCTSPSRSSSSVASSASAPSYHATCPSDYVCLALPCHTSNNAAFPSSPARSPSPHKHDIPRPRQSSSPEPSEEQRHQSLLDFVTEVERQQEVALGLYRVQAIQIATELPLLQEQAIGLKQTPSDSIHHKSLKASLVVLYRRATMLFNFMVFHRTVFDVFIAEYDRLLMLSASAATVRGLSMSCEVFETQLEELSKCDELIRHCRAIVACYADVFEHGDAIRGKMMLIARMTDRPQDSALSFRLGFKNGVTAVLFLFAVKAVVFDSQYVVLSPSVISTAAFKTYRFVFGVMIFVWLWGCNVWIWTHYRVNFVHIFQFDPRTRLTHRDIWSEASNLTIIFFLNLMAFLFCRNRGWESKDYLFSTGLFLWFLAKGVLPWPFSKWKTRRYFLRRFLNTIMSPWAPCAFADVYFGDVLTSMNKLFVDFFTAWCFLLSSPAQRISGQLVGSSVKWLIVPIMAGLPFFWRFSQCVNRFWETGDRWPHLVNAGKYLTAHTVTIMGAFHTFLSHSGQWNQFRTVWLCASLLSAAYAFLWDVTMDWGLCRGSGIHFLLRDNRSYPTHWYYFAIFSNLFLRLSWTITILPFSSNPYWVSDSAYDIYMSPVLIFLELFRRFQWGVFRVDCAQTYDREFGNNLNVPLLFGIDEAHVPKSKSRRPPSIIFEVAGIFCLFLLLGVVVAR